MRIAEYKQIGVETEEHEILVPAEYDENGNIISEEHFETIKKEIPKMGVVYRDATPEEEFEMNNIKISPIEQIEEIKNQLREMDYKTSKYVDGEYTEEEWKEITAERKSLRDKIHKLEEELNI